MKRKLIALAVATAFAAPAVMAEVTIYGKVHMDVRSTQTDATDTGTDTDNFSVNSNTSKLGFKGTEDLGNGLSAIFKYEMGYDVDGDSTNSPIESARNAYLGLAGDFGTVLIGRHDTPAKMAYYAAGNDHLGDSIIDLNRIGFTETRANNAIAYVSPTMAGMKLAAAIIPGEQTGAADTTDENGLMDSYSVGLMYAANGLKAGLGYQNLADTSTVATTNNDAETFQLGASYTMDAVTIGAQYGKNDNVDNNIVTATDGTTTLQSGIKSTNMAISGKYQMGNNAIIANYGKGETETTDLLNATTIAKTTYTGVGFKHDMSKRTNVYVAYNNADTDGGDQVSQVGVGIVHTF